MMRARDLGLVLSALVACGLCCSLTAATQGVHDVASSPMCKLGELLLSSAASDPDLGNICATVAEISGAALEVEQLAALDGVKVSATPNEARRQLCMCLLRQRAAKL